MVVGPLPSSNHAAFTLRAMQTPADAWARAHAPPATVLRVAGFGVVPPVPQPPPFALHQGAHELLCLHQGQIQSGILVLTSQGQQVGCMAVVAATLCSAGLCMSTSVSRMQQRQSNRYGTLLIHDLLQLKNCNHLGSCMHSCVTWAIITCIIHGKLNSGAPR